jgi:hypothetical protein
MATDAELQELLGRALSDEAFRACLLDDPLRAASAAGYDLTPEQLAALKTVDLQTVADALDERLLKRLGGL